MTLVHDVPHAADWRGDDRFLSDGGGRYATSDKLVCLEREDHAILFDGHHFSPLRVERGGWDLVGALGALRAPMTREQIAQRIMPEEALDLLHSLGIVRAFEPSQPQPRMPMGGELAPEHKQALHITLLVQQSCNMGCVYCLNGPKTYRVEEKPSITLDNAINVISALRKNYDPDCGIGINFFGGEPMIAWKKVASIMEWCAAEFPRYSFRMTTNMSLMPAPFLEIAKRYGLTFEVNVDGPEPIHDRLRPLLSGRQSFRKVTENIARVIDAGLTVQLRMILTALNAPHIHETIDLHRSLRTKVSTITPLRGANSDGDEFGPGLYADPEVVRAQVRSLLTSRLGKPVDFYPAIEILRSIQDGSRVDQYCGASVQHGPVVDERGELYNCVWFVGNEDFRLGAVDHDTRSVSYDMAREDAFHENSGVAPDQACARCGYRELCGGPCPATRIMGEKLQLFETERRIKCSLTKPIVDFFMEGIVNGVEFRT